MNKRSIRLKENVTDTDRFLKPTTAYLHRTNGNILDTGYRVRTDSNAAILTGNSDILTPSQKDLIFLGDSFTESTYVSEINRFSAIVERTLSTRVYNYSYSGTTTLQLLNMFLAKIIPLHDSYNSKVVVFVPTSDIDCLLELNSGYWSSSPRYSPITPPGKENFNPTGMPQFSQIFPVFKSLVDSIINFGYELHVVLPCYQKFESPDEKAFLTRYFNSLSKAESIISYRNLAQAIVRDTCLNFRIPFTDLNLEIRKKDNLQKLEINDIFYDDRHLSETGSNIVSKILSDELQVRK